jgi:hypothetical protein
MRIGTKSVLFGAHCFFLHPWFVALAWFRLFGFRRVTWRPTVSPHTCTDYCRDECENSTHLLDWRLWLAFIVHDLGYWGKPNMDGYEGEQHPWFGADLLKLVTGNGWWLRFTLYHSRYLAKKDFAAFSPLCMADKLSIALTPAWLYLPMVGMTGEHWEYIDKVRAFIATGEAARSGQTIRSDTPANWYADVQRYCRRWVEEHRDMKQDQWTSSDRQAA